jgi:hypothetical protein
LTALEILSKRHNKAILQANGVSACLTFLDFFSTNAQHAALAITANCCLNLHAEEFQFVKESLPLLARLLEQHDKKSVERICNAFYRLIDSFQQEPVILQEIASMELLKNCQQLLVVTPPVLNSVTFTNVVRMLSVMCANCPDLAITLLKNDIASTLLYLLTNSATRSPNGEVDLVQRSPSELYEITCLIGELMPRLPNDGIFCVDALLERSGSNSQDAVQWQWRDEKGVWRSYSAIDSRIIEAAHLNSDEEISLSTMGRTYTIDFHAMQQINEDSGTTRAVQRKINAHIEPPPVAVKNLNASMLMASKMTMPSTSASLLQGSQPPSVPGTFAINLNASSSKLIPNSGQIDSHGGSATNPSPSNNGNMLMNAIYHGVNIPDPNVPRNYHPGLHGGNVYSATTSQTSSLFQSASAPTSAHEALSFASVEPQATSERSSGSSKVSDILKRKVPPKRKSQHNKSKSRTDDNQAATASVTSGSSSGSVVQDFINKASNYPIWRQLRTLQSKSLLC